MFKLYVCPDQAVCFASQAKPPVIVMNMNHIGLGIIRNFRDTDFHLLGVAKQNNFVCKSKYLSAVIEINIENEPDCLLLTILEIGKKLSEKGFIIPTSEVELMFLISNAEILSAYYHLSIPKKENFLKAADKYLFYRELMRHSLNAPATFLLESADSVKAIQGKMQFPCILKPVFSGDWKTGKSYDVVGEHKAIVISDEQEMEKYYSLVSVLNPRVLLQEIVHAEDGETYSFCSYSECSGKVLWGFVTQKLLQYPENFGTALLCQTVQSPEIYDLGVQVVEKLGIDGICEVEIMREAGSGKLFVIEVNTRHWQQHILSLPLCLNITLLDYYYRTGQMNMVNSLLAGDDNKSKSAIWIDDTGYLLHCLKNVLSPGKCRFAYVTGKKKIFSTFSLKDIHPFLHLLKHKILSFFQ